MSLDESKNAEERKDEIDVSKIFSKIKKNNYVFGFAILACIALVISTLGILNVNLGNNVINKSVHLFPYWIFLFLTVMLIFSSICAYYNKYSLMFLPVLLWILLISAYIRTSNISGLKDVTTGDWTLGPDLDPFLYLRLAKDIAIGGLHNPDMMRYVPIGAENFALKNLMPWAIFLLYKLISIFKNVSLTYAAIILPVVLFVISTIGFALFVKTLSSFKFSKNKSWICAIIASLFYISTPQMLHRTVAGIPEIESLGMVFFWFAFLFFTLAWKNGKTKKMILYGLLAGVSTGLMAWSWGGYRYIHMILSLTALILFLFEKEKKKNLIIFASWSIPAIIASTLNFGSIKILLMNYSDTGFTVFVLMVMVLDFVLFNTKIKERLSKEKIKIPNSVTSLLILIILVLVYFLITNPGFFVSILKEIPERLLFPYGRNRVGLTIAENKAPYLNEVLSGFGNLFWIFFGSCIVIFYEASKKFNLKQKVLLNLSFIIFLITFIFSRFSSSSILNGENFISEFLYFGGLIFFIATIIFLYIKAHLKKDEKTINDFKEINFLPILLLSFSVLAIISMRGAIRLFFIIAPILALVSPFLVIKFVDYRSSSKKNSMTRIFSTIIILILLVVMWLTFLNYTTETMGATQATVPSAYEQQWQKAMAWVRNNTLEGSVFVHWWDYGYWVQSIGERPTVSDGGHAVGYWDQLTGRYLLTTTKPEIALSFMKTHNVSYLLIDSTDIGKYSAYASIGSDESGTDRLSWIPTMVSDPKQVQETANSTIRIYQGGSSLDSDIIYNQNGTQIFLPANKAGIAGIISETKENNGSISFSKPQGVFVYNNNQIRIPIRYIYYDGKLLDFKEGLNEVVYIMPLIYSSGQGYQIDNLGALMYLSEKTAWGLVGQLYILNDPLGKYKTVSLAYSQQDSAVEFLKSQGANVKDFVYFNGLRGPIKIWKVEYPPNIIERKEFLSKNGTYGEFDNLQFTK